MLCNAIQSNPDFLQVEHLDKLGQPKAPSRSLITNYLTLQCTTAFQLDLKRPTHSTHHTDVNRTNSTSNNNNKSSVHNGKGQNNGHNGYDNDNKSNENPNHIALPMELWDSLPASAKTTISQHNHQYNVNTAQQDDAGHIPKAYGINCPHM